LDFRYLEDYILDIEENGQIESVICDKEILPGIQVIHTPVHTDGGLTVLIDTPKGKAAITGFCVIKENFCPPKEIRAMEMDVIPPGTCVHTYEAYDIMTKVKNMAEILLPLHEPEFAALESIP
jgi:glyoxylase-like metal-dependent hydrolase (beta-lactamase superfamily II)